MFAVLTKFSVSPSADEKLAVIEAVPPVSCVESGSLTVIAPSTAWAAPPSV
jgi:hypothetical protein